MLKLLLVLGNKEGTKPLVIWASVVRSAYLISSASVLSPIRMFLVIDQTAVSTSPELNSKSDLIIRVGTVVKRAGFTCLHLVYASGVCSVGIDTSAYVLLLSKSLEVRVTRTSLPWWMQK